MDERRRRILRTTGVALAAGLAGCAGADDEEPTPGESPTDEPTETATATETATDTATETTTATTTETATATATETATPTSTAQAPTATYDVSINNVGVSAWVVTRDSSGELAPLEVENPTMTFEVGARYEVRNRGWDAHPFALRGSDNAPLLSQSRDGRYEDDAAVDWVDEGDTVAFTVSDALAADLDRYICTIHSSMVGTATTA